MLSLVCDMNKVCVVSSMPINLGCSKLGAMVLCLLNETLTLVSFQYIVSCNVILKCHCVLRLGFVVVFVCFVF